MSSAFGTPAERSRALYQALLTRPGLSPAEIARRYGWRDEDLTEALTGLARLGMATPAPQDPETWVAQSTAAAFRSLIGGPTSELARLADDLRRVQESAAEVLESYHDTYVSHLLQDDAHLVVGAAEITRVLDEATDTAHTSVVMLHPGKTPPAEALEAGLAREREVLARGVRVQTVLLESALPLPRMHGYVREVDDLGTEVRIAQTLPLRLILVDDVMAVVSMPPALLPDGEEVGAVVIRSVPLISVFRELFGYYWDTSAAFRGLLPTRDPEHSQRRRDLLQMLASGLTDEVIARRLGVSERTVRRLVSELSDELEAASRFQAGVNAARLGWVDR
ncbi:MAG TPA: helix-turn-helix domain-containing protein [Actinospica sp.]|nr:helix-turn-helix domain-containing protein [Actinospica sp.]